MSRLYDRLKHAIPHGSQGWISVSVKSAGTHIEARVSDSGPGVASDYLDQTRERLGMQIVTASSFSKNRRGQSSSSVFHVCSIENEDHSNSVTIAR